MHFLKSLCRMACLLTYFSLFAFGHSLRAQYPEAEALEKTVYNYNNHQQYDSSKQAITTFLNRPGISFEDSYFGYLFLSYTFKRLFDYESTLYYLDSALYFGQRSINPDYFINNIAAQKAFAYFDVHQYSRADSLMTALRKQNYQHLNGEIESKIIMQEAYLLFKQRRYQAAEERYTIALAKMQLASPCDQPMIYGKLIELYGAEQKIVSLREAYRRAVSQADSCGIVKYRLYATEMMVQALEAAGNYREALYYVRLRDSLNTEYNNLGHLENLRTLEVRHQTKTKEQQIQLQEKTIQYKNLLISFLIVGLVGVGFMVIFYLQQLRQKKSQQEQQNIQRFTSQLLQKTEDDRRRIAGHLHDSISHELLHLKNTLPESQTDVRQRIDTLIDDVRHISRHLHPIVFDRVGLAHSLQHLAERVQHQNRFHLTAEVSYNKGLPPDAELQLYRISQEAVTNMIKHSAAVAGKITLHQSGSEVVLELKDNGKGCDLPTVLNSDGAFGLHNILERSRAAGGKATLRSDSSGTVITIKIPLPS